MRFAAPSAAFLNIRFCWDVDALTLNEWLLMFQIIIFPLPQDEAVQDHSFWTVWPSRWRHYNLLQCQEPLIQWHSYIPADLNFQHWSILCIS